MLRWLTGKGARTQKVAQIRAAIDDARWQRVCRRLPFIDRLSPPERDLLLEKSAWILASKTINGAQGFVLQDDWRLSIAIQASLPILYLSEALYEGWDEIIVYPSGFRIARRDEDDDGVVHEYIEEASGEAWEGGPIVLSWEDVAAVDEGVNVVIHEFAHKIDLHSGPADGVPDLSNHPELPPKLWRQILAQSYADFCRALDDLERAIPADVDPEGEDGEQWYATLPLDPYAATDHAEFFAVSSERFFIDPAPMYAAMPQWYALLESYYRQNTR